MVINLFQRWGGEFFWCWSYNDDDDDDDDGDDDCEKGNVQKNVYGWEENISNMHWGTLVQYKNPT